MFPAHVIVIAAHPPLKMEFRPIRGQLIVPAAEAPCASPFAFVEHSDVERRRRLRVQRACIKLDGGLLNINRFGKRAQNAVVLASRAFRIRVGCQFDAFRPAVLHDLEFSWKVTYIHAQAQSVQ